MDWKHSRIWTDGGWVWIYGWIPPGGQIWSLVCEDGTGEVSGFGAGRCRQRLLNFKKKEPTISNKPNKKLPGAAGIATRSKDASRGSWPYY